MAAEENKYKTALSARIREEEAAEKRQEKLRKKYGVSGDVAVSKKSAGSTLVSVFRILIKVLASVLAFLFLIVLLDPEMRRMFLDMPFFHMIRGMT